MGFVGLWLADTVYQPPQQATSDGIEGSRIEGVLEGIVGVGVAKDKAT